MATYDYKNVRTGQIVERIFMPREPAPRTVQDSTGDTWKRQFPGPRIVTADTRHFQHIPKERELRARGSQVIEPGLERDIARANRYKREKQSADLDLAIEKTVEPIFI